jgi:pre-rRNA-processing protein TSR1
MGEAVRFVDSPEAGGEKGTLVVRGTVRGARLSADRLVHIPGWGDYQVEKVSQTIELVEPVFCY